MNTGFCSQDIIKSIIRLLCCCMVFFVFSIPAHADFSAIQLSIDTPLHDDITEEHIDTIINSDKFTPLKHNEYFKGNPWLKVEWDKQTAIKNNFLINDFQMQAVEKYFLIKDNQVIKSYISGNNLPFDSRPVNHFKFAMDVQQADYALVKVCCDVTVPRYFRLLNKDELQKDYYHNLIKYAVLYSLLVLLIFYNAFIYLYLHEIQYLWYCLYLSTVSLFLLSVSGIGKQFLLPDFVNYDAVTINIVLMIPVTSTLFILNFLDRQYISKTSLKLAYTTIAMNLVLMVVILGTYFFFPDDFYHLIKVYGVLVEILSLITLIIDDYIIIVNILSKDGLAKIMLLGYSLINTGSVVFIVRYNGIIENSNSTQFFMEACAVLEAVILSLGLGQKIQKLREEKSLSEERRLLQQQQFSMQLLQVQEQEKKQLSSALHDNFTHQLLILKNDIKNKLGTQSNESKQVDNILNDMRDLSHLIHPYLLEKLGLKVALSKILNEAAKTYDLDINFAIEDVQLNEEQSIIIYRIVQEALNNIIKHANASECLIAISHDKEQEEVVVLIKDDGDGFDSHSTQGLGLNTITERCQMLGGEKSIKSNTNGTELCLIFPYQYL